VTGTTSMPFFEFILIAFGVGALAFLLGAALLSR
jgi:hypothetical protein